MWKPMTRRIKESYFSFSKSFVVYHNIRLELSQLINALKSLNPLSTAEFFSSSF